MIDSKLRRIVTKNQDLLLNSSSDLSLPPVFTFHDVTREQLEPQLRYLYTNGYRTLTADQLYERLLTNETLSDREIVLTFDDGNKSLWSDAYPILSKYGFTAVAFILPGLISSKNGRQPWSAAQQRLSTWDEIKEMSNSGIIDFQVHSMFHHTIFISRRIVGYAAPNHKFSFLDDYFFPVRISDTNILFPDQLPYGTPLYESASRFGKSLRYIDSISLRNACTEFVAKNGGEMFFQHSNWKILLDSFAHQYISKHNYEPRFETAKERSNSIRHDLREAKSILEDKLPNKKIRHFCFPWNEGCSLSAKISAEEGYITNFWGYEIPNICKKQNYPLGISRLDSLYIWRLPGKGKYSLAKILSHRFSKINVKRYAI